MPMLFTCLCQVERVTRRVLHVLGKLLFITRRAHEEEMFDRRHAYSSMALRPARPGVR